MGGGINNYSYLNKLEVISGNRIACSPSNKPYRLTRLELINTFREKIQPNDYLLLFDLYSRHFKIKMNKLIILNYTLRLINRIHCLNDGDNKIDNLGDRALYYFVKNNVYEGIKFIFYSLKYIEPYYSTF